MLCKLSKTIAIFVLLLIVSCSKNSSEIKQQNGKKEIWSYKPANPSLTLKLNEEYSLNMDSDQEFNFGFPQDLFVDSQNNCYVLDSRKANILKFNNKGKLIKSIGQKGTGPGKLDIPMELFISKDTLNVFDSANKSISKFDLNGNFEYRTAPLNQGIRFLEKNKHNNFSLFTSLDFEMKNDKEQLKVSSFIANNNKFKNCTNIFSATMNDADMGVYNKFFPEYVIGDNEFYFTKIDNSKYSIEAKDFNNKELFKIRRNFRKIAMSDKEIKKYVPNYKHNAKSLNYKSAINHLLFDDKGYLWVFPFKERVMDENSSKYNFDKLNIEIFKDGVLQNEFVLDIGYNFENQWQSVYLFNDRIYLLDRLNKLVKCWSFKFGENIEL